MVVLLCSCGAGEEPKRERIGPKGDPCEVAETFITNYLNKEEDGDIVKFLRSDSTVSKKFISAYSQMLDSALNVDPIIGFDFDRFGITN